MSKQYFNKNVSISYDTQMLNDQQCCHNNLIIDLLHNSSGGENRVNANE